MAPAVTDNLSFLVGGNWQVSSTGIFTHSSGKVVLDATDTNNTIVTTSENSDSFYQLELNAAGTWTANNEILDIDNQLKIADAGAVLALGGSDTTLDLTSATFVNYGTLQLEGDESLTNFANDTANGGTVKYTGSGSYTAGLIGGDSYHHLIFASTGSGTWVLDNALDVNGNLTISAGTLDVKTGSDYGITLDGNWLNAGMFEARGGMVNFSGTVSGKTITANGTNGAFHDISFTGSGGAWTLQDTMNVTGVFTVTNGTFISGTGTVNLSGVDATYLDENVNETKTVWTGGTLNIQSNTTQILPSGESYENLQLGRYSGVGPTLYTMGSGVAIGTSWTIDSDARVVLTVSATGIGRPYDGTLTAQVNLSDNHISGWYENYSYTCDAEFADKH
ncbi:MAG: hypothetical protein WC352_00260, partial [Candidatus Omnitrophota bacterium]